MKLSEFKHDQRVRNVRTGKRALVVDIEHNAVFLIWMDGQKGWMYKQSNWDELEEYDGDCPFFLGVMIEGLTQTNSWERGEYESWEPLRMVAWFPDGRITVHYLSGRYAGNDTVVKYNKEMFRKKQS